MAFEFINSLKDSILNEELFEDLEEYSLIEEAKTDSLLNFYAKVGFLRDEKEEKIIDLFMKAYEEDKVKALKLLFYTRDKEQGLGERKIFRIIINHLGKMSCPYLKANINLIPIYGRWDDLYSIFDTPLQGEAIKLIRRQINEDLKSKEPSTLSKWLKSENASSEESKELARKTRIALDLSSKDYRVLLSHLRKRVNIVEEDMSAGKWDKIKYEELSKSARMKYSKAFLKHDKERYLKFLEENAITDEKEEEDNESYFEPYDVINELSYNLSEYDKTFYINEWKRLKNSYKKNTEDTLVCLGLNKKYSKEYIKSPAFCAGISTALYFLDNNKEKFKKYIITMNPKPNFKKITKTDLVDRILEVEEASLTHELNVEAALDLVLFAAIKNDISADKIPKRLLFIMDSKCNLKFRADKEEKSVQYFLSPEEYARIKAKWTKSNYPIPDLCFWKIDGVHENSKIIVDDNGFQYASGYSHEVFKFIVQGEKVSSNSIEDEVFNNIRYSKVSDNNLSE